MLYQDTEKPKTESICKHDTSAEGVFSRTQDALNNKKTNTLTYERARELQRQLPRDTRTESRRVKTPHATQDQKPVRQNEIPRRTHEKGRGPRTDNTRGRRAAGPLPRGSWERGTARPHGKTGAFSQIKHALPTGPSNQAHRYLPKGAENLCPHENLHVDVSSFINCPNLEATEAPFSRRMFKSAGTHPGSGMLSVPKLKEFPSPVKMSRPLNAYR